MVARKNLSKSGNLISGRLNNIGSEGGAATINITDSEVWLESGDNIVGVEIHYNGSIKIISRHNKFGQFSDWMMVCNNGIKNKNGVLLYFSNKLTNFKTGKFLLFKYAGYLTITKCIVASKNTDEDGSSKVNECTTEVVHEILGDNKGQISKLSQDFSSSDKKFNIKEFNISNVVNYMKNVKTGSDMKSKKDINKKKVRSRRR